MLFPVCVHKDPDSAYGVAIPDLPGCFTAGDTLEEAIANVQEAVETYLHGENLTPRASPLEKHIHDPRYEGGVWVLVNIDLSFLSPRRKRVNIMIPADVLAEVDRVAAKKGRSRSAFLVDAARRALSDIPSGR